MIAALHARGEHIPIVHCEKIRKRNKKNTFERTSLRILVCERHFYYETICVQDSDPTTGESSIYNCTHCIFN
jgi:hypothetical protein